MDYQIQVKAYRILEHLLSNGNTMSTLPISRERAGGIISMREAATERDLALLEDAGALAMTATIQK